MSSATTYGAIILAAGEGSRLMSSGVPRFFKPLLQVDGKFLIEHSFDFCQKWGIQIQDCVVVTSPKLKGPLQGLFSLPKVVVQNEPTGVMAAIREGLLEFVGKDHDKILILCSDNTYGTTDPKSLRILFEDKNGLQGMKSGVTTRYFDEKTTRDRLTAFYDGLLMKRGSCDDAWSWIGPLVLHRDTLLDYFRNIPLTDVYDTQLLETHLNEIAGSRFIGMPADCADWGVISNGKENIFA